MSAKPQPSGRGGRREVPAISTECHLLVVAPGCQHSLGNQLLDIHRQEGQVPEDTDAHPMLLQVLPAPNQSGEHRKHISLYCTSAKIHPQLQQNWELQKGKTTKCFSGVQNWLRFDYPKPFHKGKLIIPHTGHNQRTKKWSQIRHPYLWKLRTQP